jgi:signal transduction histidine kinase
MDTSHKFLIAFLVLVPTLILASVLIMLLRRNRDLQRRNDSLSDILTQVVQTSSDERLSLTRKHADEREKLRLECMLQLDATHRTTTSWFTEMLLQKLKELRPASPSGRAAG